MTNQKNPIREMAELDKLFFEPRRYAILNALRMVSDLDYIYLRRITGLSQGNLATHLRKLEEAGLIEIKKRIILRRPNSRVYLTEEGRQAFEDHRRRLHELDEDLEHWNADDDEYRPLWHRE